LYQNIFGQKFPLKPSIFDQNYQIFFSYLDDKVENLNDEIKILQKELKAERKRNDALIDKVGHVDGHKGEYLFLKKYFELHRKKFHFLATKIDS